MPRPQNARKISSIFFTYNQMLNYKRPQLNLEGNTRSIACDPFPKDTHRMSTHQASHEFADQAAADRATSGEALKPLVAEFDRCWPDVKRTREIFVLAEELGAG